MTARRVALVSPRYAPDIGGVEEVVRRLAEGVRERGWAPEVLTTDPSGRLPSFEVIRGVPVRRFPTLAGDDVFFVSPAMGLWLLRRVGGYDLVHAHSYHAAVALEAAIAARALDVPVVVSSHYHRTGHTPARRALHALYRPFGRSMLRGARQVVCGSEAEARLVREDAGEAVRTRVVPLGVDRAEIAAAPPGTPPVGRVTVLAAGRLEPYKQAARLVEALALLPRSFRAVVLGEGSARADVAATAARAGVTDRVELPGHVAREALLAEMRAADVFVSLSRHESFGLVVAEAAEAGAAVVASDIPAHREVAERLGDRVRFVHPDAAPAEVAAVIREAARLGRAPVGATDVASWDDTVTGTLAAYEAALGGRDRASSSRRWGAARPAARSGSRA